MNRTQFFTTPACFFYLPLVLSCFLFVFGLWLITGCGATFSSSCAYHYITTRFYCKFLVLVFFLVHVFYSTMLTFQTLGQCYNCWIRRSFWPNTRYWALLVLGFIGLSYRESALWLACFIVFLTCLVLIVLWCMHKLHRK